MDKKTRKPDLAEHKRIIEQNIAVLDEMADQLWDFEAEYPNEQIVWSDEAMRGAVKVFMACLLSRMWDHQEETKMPRKDREKQALELGEKIRQLVLLYTDVDTHKIYK